ncbi:MAG: fumarate hydratase [Oscillospiraceae bacterium]|nr:fumarate hydratase [Oscillospiraceae bacterium]
MRNISSAEIVDAVAKMCMSANYNMNVDIKNALKNGMETERSEICRGVLENLIKNADIAEKKQVPICQDTGMAVFFAEVGQDVHIEGDTLTDAINKGVAKGYTDGYLRKSIVADPLRRVNTGDNTPAVIYYDMTKGDKLKIAFAPKGFGSENKSALKMLNPADGVEKIIEFVVETAKKADSNPCPPMVIGVGIGGTMDKAAVLAKKALFRSINERNKDEYYADLENLLLERINKLGIGPQGMGGTTTCIGVNIEKYPTHIAGLPVAVNISCHVTRHAEIIL